MTVFVLIFLLFLALLIQTKTYISKHNYRKRYKSLQYTISGKPTMETLENYHQLILETGQTTTEKALQLFDTLKPVNLDFMFGRWQGSGLHTAHPMDGLLESSN